MLEVGQPTWKLNAFDRLYFFIITGKSMSFSIFILFVFIFGCKRSLLWCAELHPHQSNSMDSSVLFLLLAFLAKFKFWIPNTPLFAAVRNFKTHRFLCTDGLILQDTEPVEQQ